MNQTCSLKTTGYWSRPFFACLWTLSPCCQFLWLFIYLLIYLFFTLNFVLLLKRCIFTEFAFSEAVTCKRECLAPHTRCVIRQGTEEICLCIPECPKEIKHVCGSDKVTYNNMCLLEKAACENNKVITVVKTGRCQGISLVRDCH